MGKMGPDEEMVEPIRGPVICKGFVFAPSAANLGVEDNFGMREEDIEVKGTMFIFVAKGGVFIESFCESGVNWFEVDEGFINRIDEVLG